jgi:hypothetical protein
MEEARFGGSSQEEDVEDGAEAEDDEMLPVAVGDDAQLETSGAFAGEFATDEAVAAASALSDLMELQKTSMPVSPMIGRRDAHPASVDQKSVDPPDGADQAGAADEESAEEDLSTNGSVAMEESDPESPSKPSHVTAQVWIPA